MNLPPLLCVLMLHGASRLQSSLHCLRCNHNVPGFKSGQGPLLHLLPIFFLPLFPACVCWVPSNAAQSAPNSLFKKAVAVKAVWVSAHSPIFRTLPSSCHGFSQKHSPVFSVLVWNLYWFCNNPPKSISGSSFKKSTEQELLSYSNYGEHRVSRV